jgi:hypothetical protein
MQIEQPGTKRSDDNISELIFKWRNDFIKVFLDERKIKDHFQQHFKLAELSKIKIEFIKRDIKLLLNSPINQELYLSIFSDLKKNDTEGLKPEHETVFRQEINALLKRYVY